MKKTFDFGKIGYDNPSHKINKVTIDVELTRSQRKDWLTNEKKLIYAFTADVNIWNSKCTDIVAGGQMFEELLPYFKNNELFTQIYNLWYRWQSNDLKSGNKEQCDLILKWRKDNKIPNIWAYEQECGYLKSIGKYEIEDFKYGFGWWCEEIPTDVLEEIKNILI